MGPKKEMAPIGLDPIDAGTALGIQSKAELKYTNLTYRNLIQNKRNLWYCYKRYWVKFHYVYFDFFNQLFHIIIIDRYV